jgi:hypothetical protein
MFTGWPSLSWVDHACIGFQRRRHSHPRQCRQRGEGHGVRLTLYTVGVEDVRAGGRVLSLLLWLSLVFCFMELLFIPELKFVTEGPTLWELRVVLHGFWAWVGCRIILASVELSV